MALKKMGGGGRVPMEEHIPPVLKTLMYRLKLTATDLIPAKTSHLLSACARKGL